MIKNRQISHRNQRGVSMIAALLSLVIFGLMVAATMQGNLTAAAASDGRIEGNLIDAVKVAANNYTLENYAALQNAQPVTVGAVTVPSGVADGETMSPSVQTLIDTGYLRAGTTERASLGNGTYRIRLELTPAGCVPAQCQVVGHVYSDQPLARVGTADLSNVRLNAAVTALGGDALYSTNITPANFNSLDGSVRPNPVVGNPAWIVGTKVGYGSIGWGRFLVVGDPRDPDFKGAATVMGQITSQAGVGVRPNGSACNLGEILASGQVLSRAADCVRTTWMDGSTGTIGVASVAGGVATSRIVLTGSDGSLQAFNAAGALEAGIRTDDPTGISTIFSDAVVVNATAAKGGACTIPNASVYGTGATGNQTTLLKCEGGTWKMVGLPLAVAGAACPLNADGLLARDAQDLGLVCVDQMYRPIASMLGKVGIQTIAVYGQGAVVPNPSCPASMTPNIVALGVVSSCVVGGGAAGCANNTGAFKGTIDGSTRTVSITGSDNSVAASDALLAVATFCSSS